MPQTIDLRCLPTVLNDPKELLALIQQKSGSATETSPRFQIIKRSIDSRKSPVMINLRVEVYGQEEEIVKTNYTKPSNNVSDAKQAIVVGAGPAGLFAALELIDQGIKPIILERGKQVKERRRDLVGIIRDQEVHPDSNYCFGEGGAGTYSDGKLYTRSKKRGDVRKVLEWFVAHGADENILVEAHPHIGTNKLPQIITTMRETIESRGGELHFEQRVIALITGDRKLEGVKTADGKKWLGPVILATGHSARDIFEMLHAHEIEIEAKPFAIGVRVEHAQSLIDKIQYHGYPRQEILPPASYSLVHQVKGRGVYSFCMCPGGIMAPCATENGEIVTNGWSPSKRNNPWANSGIVVSVEEKDWQQFDAKGPLAALEFQKMVEKKCWEAGGKTQRAPAQRLTDFVKGRMSKDLPECSYGPGIVPARVDKLLPDFITTRLQEAFIHFGKVLRGYMTEDAVVVAPESRTSSPVRIPRDKETLEHPQYADFYPCGEGAGYAGGIVSAALDGIKTARALSEKHLAVS